MVLNTRKILLIISSLLSTLLVGLNIIYANVKNDESVSKQETTLDHTLKSSGYDFYLSDSKDDYPYTLAKNMPDGNKLKFYNSKIVNKAINNKTKFEVMKIDDYKNGISYEVRDHAGNIQGWTNFNSIRDENINKKQLKNFINAEIKFVDGNKNIKVSYLYKLANQLKGNNKQLALESIKEAIPYKQSHSLLEIPTLLQGLV
ncbi:hypothetical protein GSH19_04735 [Lactobacillus sp. S2-2]|uniref:hypothetical protein n=1 Tax=Lactobacillus sp. S2-2 TaxID=2692917 RepID=UPI001F46A70F|nr:hypothetical protein [Lactobacillus sp. S2-2]MCF6515457.1 hypothetical protein [Lactobacillus sp. S2-2]